MRISIVIPAFNEERLLGATLEQVNRARNAFAERGWESEVIVCDNNSTDRTAELARAAGAKVVFEPVNQIARARNRGAEASTGDWLVFVDADSHPSPGLFAETAEKILCGRYVAGGCTVRLDSNHSLARLGMRLWNGLSRTFRLLAGSFIFCEAAAFWQVGGFNRELFVAEELDLTKKLKSHARERGKRLVILHQHPLLTSARKFHLYSLREYIWFLSRLTFSPRKVLGSRAECQPWYDGRR